jgi:hypothetical protein
MGFKSGAQGINKKGKVKGNNLGDDGAKVSVETGGKKTLGKTNADMKAMGRNLAKIKNQKGGK